MNRSERLGLHALLFCLFAVAGLNFGLLADVSVARWSLPLLYALYVGGWMLWRRWRGLGWPRRWQLLACVLVPFALFMIAWALSGLYDTSWDGQDYHQTAIIALHDGWNPWHSRTLPVHAPANAQYAIGYPKATWLLQAGIYALTGRLQSVVVTNVVAGGIAAVFVYGALRQLRLGRAWRGIITLLAVCEVHVLQQLPTFMADGYSYLLSLTALALLWRCAREPARLGPLAGFLASWLLLAGSKFSNLVVCALLMLALLVVLARARAWRARWFAPLLLGFALVSFAVLWVPYGTNWLRFGSPLYPQNQPGESAKLRFDNVPNNLKHAGRAALLGYGIFSHTEAPDAGNPTSAHNIAQLKWPFTFHWYEIGQMNNFQGRVASAGVLFSGLFVLSGLLLAWLIVRAFGARAQLPDAWRLARGAGLLVGVILLAALLIPVPNKLRYSPLVTLIPLVALALGVYESVASQASWAKKPKRARRFLPAACIALAAGIGANALLAGGALMQARLAERTTINRQLTALARSDRTYAVQATAFYGNYARLQEHHVRFVVAAHLPCVQPVALAYTYDTTQLCALPR